MRSLYLAAVTTVALAASMLTGSAAQSAETKNGFEVYVGDLTRAQLGQLRAAAGVDLHDTAVHRNSEGRFRVEVVMTPAQAAAVAKEGVDLSVKKVDGRRASTMLGQQATDDERVFRSYSEPGGIRDELVETAADHPDLAKLVTVGTSLNGQAIYAVKVTKNARAIPDGTRPAVLYLAAQHAREWITPEMVRRLLHHVLAGYGDDAQITELVKSTELWFLPVANPDGYDHTFTEGNRLWRKNLRDNNGDNQIAPGDGVDPNRNYPTHWGYDNEGSSPNPSSETYRGTAPASEPETRALDALARKIRFEYAINYHSAAELLLYGTGWQVSTPTPDDIVYQALAGTDEHSGVPGYDPDVSAELYTTNGETTEHLHEAYGTLAFTPEMSTCATASASDPDDEWLPEDCPSIFTFPEDEALIQAEYAKNVPFALNVAKATHHPDSPEGAGGTTADFAVDRFAVSHGEASQAVAVTARRALEYKRLRYRINGGETRSAPVEEWKGGERYGDDNDVYFAEYRGTVRGQRPGDRVEVWFSGLKPGSGPVTSDRFSYTVAGDTGGDVLILAAEDVTGVTPGQGGDRAKYAESYAAALTGAGYSSDVYDMDRHDRTPPHHLGVLSHYDAVVWETGDDVIPRAAGQPPGTAAASALDTELAVRDYLNEGGKLLMAGQYNGFAQGADGVYYYNPSAPPECTTPGEYPCLPLFNDFQQYYLGAYTYVSDGGTSEAGDPYPVQGSGGAFDGFDGTLNGGDSANNQSHTASFLTTSSFLPPEEFPQFAGSAPIDWRRPGGAPYDPRSGAYYLSSQRSDQSYKRVTRTIDLTGASSANLEFWTSYDVEPGWDHVFVEARTSGGDDWTTLPDANGHTGQDTGDSCEAGWADIHPQLAHYQGTDCSPAGTTGAWHAASGSSGGWQEWSVDLSGYAGEKVEVSISYASDWSVQGIGAFIDDVAVTVDGTRTADTSFEQGLDGWTVSGPPPGSPRNGNDWTRSVTAFEEGAGVVTEDSIWVGFGLEGLATADQRTDFVRRALSHLLG